MTKLVVIIGITGNQGGSVASTFLRDPAWRIRGLTRHPSSTASRALTAEGIEMVHADLHKPSTLNNVFKGASLVFSVTDFWKPFFTPANQEKAKELGKSIGRYAYELEVDQGKNIVDAVAKETAGLDDVGFVASTLCHAGKSSEGRYQELWHFDAKADIFPGYLKETYPELARKTSFLHTGYFFTSWGYMPGRWFAKQPDGSIQMQFPTRPDVLIPHLNPRTDVGPFVRALLQLPPQSTLMAASEWCTWPEWMKTWGEVTGVRTSYKQVSVEDFDKEVPGGAGKEIGEMYEFSSEYGYNANQANTLKTWDLEKMGIKIPTMSLREYFEAEDWIAAGILPY
ncbi:NAD(P)-binding protein [Clathrospora elynae]|uniref:NAD(P)-binding protein n=1 Tax=Clathrospora elynae TaxID=706981 RepID=A0A6A5S1A3_9PLEO|nr:NAD(P)-binding protein [Clathrospora elynae]